jgi:hypothetical protein
MLEIALPEGGPVHGFHCGQPNAIQSAEEWYRWAKSKLAYVEIEGTV